MAQRCKIIEDWAAFLNLIERYVFAPGKESRFLAFARNDKTVALSGHSGPSES